MIGKKIRLERIIDRNSGRTVIIPMDLGVTVGPIKGLTNLRDAVSKVVAGGANAVLMHKGSPRFCHRGEGKDVGHDAFRMGGQRGACPTEASEDLIKENTCAHLASGD